LSVYFFTHKHKPTQETLKPPESQSIQPKQTPTHRIANPLGK